jgi:hypothetical protein
MHPNYPINKTVPATNSWMNKQVETKTQKTSKLGEGSIQSWMDKIVFFGSHPHQGSLPQYIVTQTGMLISL